MARQVEVQGIRKLQNDLVDDLKSVVASIYEIRDDLGAKKANVFFYTKETNPPLDDIITWNQILPSPNVKELRQTLEQEEAGILGDQRIQLTGIPIENYTSEQLETISENENLVSYWVIQESGRTRAYTTYNIKRELFSYTVQIVRYTSINDNELTIDA